ncbi:MAG: type I restriction-modification system subunit M [Bacteroidales bacterium]|nr:type I restriction-modification system subunit M [Bacteroidales bacterium]
MAKKIIQPKSMEEALWEACNKLRGSIESSEYKHVVLSLIFLKYAGDHFEKRRREIVAEGHEAFADNVAFYAAKNVFYLAPESRWDYIMENAKQPDIALKIDKALSEVERQNKPLKGALPSNYYANLGLDTSKLASLLDEVNKIDTLKDEENDLIGRVYEYFLGKFALAEGKGKGEFYTPKCIVNLIAEMIEPYEGKIYDPCCGSGGMFVQSLKFISAHHGNRKNISIYGQEYTKTTYKLAKMNLAIRGIASNLGESEADTFRNDQHKNLKADYIMANPPFNQKAWREESELTNDPRWAGFDVPPTSNANYGWILNMVSKLSCDGVAGFILANGALSADGTEYAIRKKMLERGLVEAILILPRNLFYTTDISVTLWILNNNKKARVANRNGEEVHYRDREKEVLFMDLRQMGSPYEKKYVQLTADDIARVAHTYHDWQRAGDSYGDIPEYCYSATFDEIAEKNFSLVPSKYIEFVNRDEQIDFDSKMKQLQSEMRDLLAEEEKSKAELKALFEKLGYKI